jgi:hypothetical protein
MYILIGVALGHLPPEALTVRKILVILESDKAEQFKGLIDDYAQLVENL